MSFSTTSSDEKEDNQIHEMAMSLGML